MSVVLLVKSPDTGETELTPVAAEATFGRFWRPGISALSLAYVDLFQSGLIIEAPDIQPILEELERLRAWMYRSGTPSEVVTRLDQLHARLATLKEVSDLDVWIG